jgi:glycosyltransferase involved in cell wall biosynthesis
MRVIYDISAVGNRPEARTGVARAAWTTAILLQDKLGDQISFSACGSISAAIQAEELLRNQPEFSSAILPVGRVARYVHQCQERLSQLQGRVNGHFVPGLNACEKGLTNLSRLLNITRTSINNSSLAAADLFHSPYARIPVQVRNTLPGRHVLTINDLTPLLLPEHYFAPGQRAITRRMINSVQRDDWIITISQATRHDLCNYRSIDPEHIFTVHLAASEEIFHQVNELSEINKIRDKYKIPSQQYLLTLHSLAPHKNLAYLIRTFQKIIRQERINDLSLVVCGGQGRSISQILSTLNLTQEDLHKIHFTGYVQEEDLAALYSGALAFVFPSLYEGFGLPVLEAMQCGCPVIVSNTSSLPEIVGNSGLMVSPSDVDALSEAVLKVYNDLRLREQLSRDGKTRAALFSWEKTVTETINVYQKVLAERIKPR